MKEAYLITKGTLKKYADVDKKVKKIYFYHIIYFFTFFIAGFFTYKIFNISISDEKKLSDTIALGSIFATFGSSIVAIFSLKMGFECDRFNNNIRILYKDLEPENEWYRWPFVKREMYQVLYNGTNTYQVVDNSTITFNIGSHESSFKIPTVKEDFYDLPNWKALFKMKKESKDYQSFIINHITDTYKEAIALSIWDCLLDSYNVIAKYKLSRYFTTVGEIFVLWSIVFAFIYRLL